MRSRGAQMTDIAVLVVAADDGVMPQTIEAINHAKAANVPIIVAINKIDKEGANPERVKQELTEHGIVVEEWGGDTIAVPVSAKKGENIGELLENILLVAEMAELTADPNRPARGAVIEAEVKKDKGPTASLLVQQGTLHVGDTLISGTTYDKIRTMIDDKGRRIKKAGPSMPVEISGLSDLPEAGDDFIVMENEKEARSLADQRLESERFERQHKNKMNLDELFQQDPGRSDLRRQPDCQSGCRWFRRSADPVAGTSQYGRSPRQRYPRSGRRHQRNGRHAGFNVKRGYHRVQCPSGQERACGRGKGRSRYPSVPRYLRRDRRRQARDGRDART